MRGSIPAKTMSSAWAAPTQPTEASPKPARMRKAPVWERGGERGWGHDAQSAAPRLDRNLGAEAAAEDSESPSTKPELTPERFEQGGAIMPYSLLTCGLLARGEDEEKTARAERDSIQGQNLRRARQQRRCRRRPHPRRRSGTPRGAGRCTGPLSPIGALATCAERAMVADLIAIVRSLDALIGEVDRCGTVSRPLSARRPGAGSGGRAGGSSPRPEARSGRRPRR